MRQPDAWHLGHLELTGGHDAPVASDDAAVFVDQDWVGETKLFDACRDLSDLFVGVSPAVSNIRDKIF